MGRIESVWVNLRTSSTLVPGATMRSWPPSDFHIAVENHEAPRPALSRNSMPERSRMSFSNSLAGDVADF